MKVEETFYTISKTDLEEIVKSVAASEKIHQIWHFNDLINLLINKGKISSLRMAWEIKHEEQ